MHAKQRYQKIEQINDNFPDLLRKIKNPPKDLYCSGDIALMSTKCIAIVGSRKCTAYGKNVAEKFAAKLAKAGITIVSGMAYGIDSAAHRGALSVGGKTIAVLGCGLDICYPNSNRGLMDEISAEGLLVSEYPEGSKPMPYSFPERNRIISGLSEAVIIVEATYRSGSLITAEHAIDQGRDVYAVPANITSMASAGSNRLLSEGCPPILTPEDLLRNMHIPISAECSEIDGLNDIERKILKIIKQNGETTTEYICNKTLEAPSVINGIITVLELKGLVVTSMGKVFAADLDINMESGARL